MKVVTLFGVYSQGLLLHAVDSSTLELPKVFVMKVRSASLMVSLLLIVVSSVFASCVPWKCLGKVLGASVNSDM